MRLLLLSISLGISTMAIPQHQKLPLLKVSANHRYLVTEEGEAFFWLGDTAWELFHRLDKEEALHYLNDRSAKGFTIVQAVILAELDGLNTPNAYGERPLIDNDPEKPNEKYFEHIDYIVKEAEKSGMYIGLLPTWGDKFNKAWGLGPEIFTPENAESYGEFLAKRYIKQNNIVWILGGDRWPDNAEDRAIIHAMARGIRRSDSRHLISYHPSGGKKATDYFNEDWLDIDMFQSGHDRRTRDYEFVWKGREVEPARPVINGEPRYENHPDRFKPDVFGWMDDSDVRVSAWWSMLSGAAGYTYGCHDIWQMFTADRPPVTYARSSWFESLHLPGSRQLTYLKQLLSSFSWQEMINDQSIVLNRNPKDSTFVVSSIGKDGDFIIAYTPFGKPVKTDLSKMNIEKVKAWWYNPRDGQFREIGEYKVSEQPEFTPWSTGRGSDFVLVLVDTNKNHQFHGAKRIKK